MIFVDTSALVAMADRSDYYHVPAADYLRSLTIAAGGLVITEYVLDYVLDETFTRLRLTIGHSPAAAFGNAIMTSNLYTVVNVDARIFRLAWGWFKKYDDKDFSFTDCTSFVVMKALKLEKAFTFDRHFAQAGFACCPGNDMG
ncbi:MAG TPA: type II toxin-antitoxin system VapC family toxin [Firmicutes bacterium]|nr:type II toxin-antitoxin system VapC family toxin [Bacillota bacterium]